MTTTNSHYVWTGFENQQKEALKSKLQELLPYFGTEDAISDSPRVELLCDRSREEDRFGYALQRHAQTNRAAGWLLFGEADQGQYAIFERITDFTLRRSSFNRRYPKTKAINLDLDEFFDCSSDEMRSHVFSRASDALGETEVTSYPDLYTKLGKRQVALVMFYSVVHVTSSSMVKWWASRFTEMVEEFPAVDRRGLQVIFALSITFSEEKRGFLSLFRRRQSITEFFEQQFPEHFASDEERVGAGKKKPPLVTSRLRSAKQSDVENWYENRLVKNRIKHVPKEEFLRQFEYKPEIPMGKVIDRLGDVMRRHARSIAE